VILAFLAFAWLLGIATASYTGGDPAAVIAAASLLGALAFAYRARPATAVVIVAAIPLLALAAWRYDATVPVPGPDAIQHHNGEDVRFRALINDEPALRQTTTSYRLQVSELWKDGAWRDASGAVLMTARQYPAFEYGDVLEVSGELTEPPVFDGFDYREYLARRGVGSLVSYPEATVIASDQGNAARAELIDLRADLTSSIESAVPQPEAALAAGILLGARQGLPPSLRNDMDATGTSHLVAVSGQNITILAAAVVALLAWLIGRRAACWAALVAIVSYAAFVGAEPSVVRAALMGALLVLSIAFGRQNSAWVALLLAAALMTALTPQIVHEVSFQLSFAAVLGLVVLTAPLNERLGAALDHFPRIRDFPLTRPAVELLVLSLASIAFTLPITAVNFERISLVAPITNLFVVPAFVPVAATSAVVAIAGQFSADVGSLLAWAAWLPSTYVISVIDWFAAFPLASIRIEGFSVPHAVVYYSLLGALILWLRRPVLRLPEAPKLPEVPRKGLSIAAITLVLGLASALTWLALTTPDQDRLSVTVLDVGQGDAILVETPSGNRVLVDGGPSESLLDSALGRHLPFYDRRIDLVAVTHPQADHVGGLPALLERYDVTTVLSTNAKPESLAGEHWNEAVNASGVSVIAAIRGQRLDLGDGVSLVVIAPAAGLKPDRVNLNDSSLVLRLEYGRFSMLLTGDLGLTGEQSIEQSGGPFHSTVLKVGHHGSRTSTSDRFLGLVDPSVAVISVGNDNRFGHPAPETLERLSDRDVFRTDVSGDITLTTDGDAVWVSTQR
jgi:competence protein ComEC